MVAAAGGCLAAAAAPPALGDDVFGANVETLVEWTQFSGAATAPPVGPYLSALAADGVGVARSDAAWAWVQPTRSTPLSDPASWAALDPIVAALARNGLRWQPVLDLAPAWAAQAPQTPPGCAPVDPRYLPPSDPTDFADFAQALAARYGAGGTFWAANPDLPDLPAEQFEIWNEPNIDAYWNNAPNAAQYVALYDAARAAIRGADPTAQVIVGGPVWGGQVDCAPLVTNDADYIRALFAAGGANWQVDGIGVHPYGPAVLNIVANIRREQQALRDAGRTDVPLQMTEIGWPAAPAGTPPGSAVAAYPDDASRAATLAMSADVLMGSDCDVQSFDVYSALERQATIVPTDQPAGNPYDNINNWTGILQLIPAGGGLSPSTATSDAYAAAIAREQAGDDAAHAIPVCATTGAGGSKLTVSLSVAPTQQAGCFNATVTYLGMRLYGAELQSSSPISAAGSTSFGPAFTDPDGEVGFCAPGGSATTVWAVVGGGSFDPAVVPLVASSNVVDLEDLSPPVTTTSTSSSTTATSATTDTAPPATQTSETQATTTQATPPVTSTETTVLATTATASSAGVALGPPIVSPAPRCVLHAFTVSRTSVATVRRRGLRVRVDLATIGSRRGCALSLSILLRARIAGSARATLRRAGATSLVIPLNAFGRRRLQGRWSATVTLALDLAGAPVGTGTLSERVRLGPR